MTTMVNNRVRVISNTKNYFVVLKRLMKLVYLLAPLLRPISSCEAKLRERTMRVLLSWSSALSSFVSYSMRRALMLSLWLVSGAFCGVDY